jgi:hypothetical protein
MDAVLALLGLLFLMFLVLAASVETILETFRGTLEAIGITWARGKVSVEDALKLASEFAPDNADLTTKLQAVKNAAAQISNKASQELQDLNTIQANLNANLPSTPATAGAELNAVAASVKDKLEKNERLRIFALRAIAAILGFILVYYADFYVFRIIAQTPATKDLVANLPMLQEAWVNILIGGLAASAGSSYWHDQLDKIRNVKSAVQEVKRIAA